MPRNIYILVCSQAFAATGLTMMIFVGGLVGSRLTSHPTWATLPIALMFVGAALATLPAALLMKKIGRRLGFIFSIIVAILAALLSAYAIIVKNFDLFCLGNLFIGTNAAFVQQYRFAAAESVDNEKISHAVAYVLLGTLIAAYIGPEVAVHSRNWLINSPYAGSLIALAGLYIISALFLLFYKNVTKHVISSQLTNVSTITFLRQSKFLIAAIISAGAYGMMNLIMTATPISMHVIDNFSVSSTAHILQLHLLAMYAPALITGYLINRFGANKLITVGLIFMLGCVLLASFKHTVITYFFSLVCLGMGWNFLFVSGTTLLMQHYQFNEGIKAQGLNDFIMLGISAIGSLSAGSMIYHFGWRDINLFMLPCIIIMLIAMIMNMKAYKDR